MPRFIRPRRRASSWLLRYRGYVYDSETGLYYLQSRYYDPELGRFLNADAFVSTGQGQLGNNMFAYCNNAPINRFDNCGNIPKEIFGYGFLNETYYGGGGCGRGYPRVPIDPNAAKKELAELIELTHEVANAIVNNIEADVCGGFGFYGSADVSEAAKISLGGYYNPIELCIHDGKIYAGQSYYVGGSIELLGYELDGSISQFVPYGQEGMELSSGFSLVSVGYYEVIGGNVSVKFDINEFIQDMIDLRK